MIDKVFYGLYYNKSVGYGTASKNKGDGGDVHSLYTSCRCTVVQGSNNECRGDSDVLSPFVGVIKESQVGSLLFDRYQLCAGNVVYKPFGYGKSREGIFFARYCPLRLLLFGKLRFIYVYLR